MHSKIHDIPRKAATVNLRDVTQHDLTVWPSIRWNQSTMTATRRSRVVSQQNVALHLTLDERTQTFFFFCVSIGWNQWCELATFQAYLNRQSSPPHWEHLGLTGSRWTRGIFSTPKDFALSGSKSPTAHVNAISHDFSGGGRLRAGGSALRILMPLVILNGNRTSNGSSQSCTPPATQRSS